MPLYLAAMLYMMQRSINATLIKNRSTVKLFSRKIKKLCISFAKRKMYYYLENPLQLGVTNQFGFHQSKITVRLSSKSFNTFVKKMVSVPKAAQGMTFFGSPFFNFLTTA